MTPFRGSSSAMIRRPPAGREILATPLWAASIIIRPSGQAILPVTADLVVDRREGRAGVFWPLVHEAQRRSTAATRMRRTPITREAMAAARFLATQRYRRPGYRQPDPAPASVAVARPHGDCASRHIRRIRRYLTMSSLPMYKITQTVTALAAPTHFHHFISSPPVWLARRVAGRPPFLPGNPRLSRIAARGADEAPAERDQGVLIPDSVGTFVTFKAHLPTKSGIGKRGCDRRVGKGRQPCGLRFGRTPGRGGGMGPGFHRHRQAAARYRSGRI